jgi:hypothetical protein
MLLVPPPPPSPTTTKEKESYGMSTTQNLHCFNPFAYVRVMACFLLALRTISIFI